jgi:hypothetical protein
MPLAPIAANMRRRSSDGRNVKFLTDRQLHLVKKALAMASLGIEPLPGRAQPTSDYADTKALLREIAESEVEFAYYFIAARMAITGTPEDVPRSAAP